MLKVDKGTEIPNSLDGENSRGSKETKKAIEFFKNLENKSSDFNFIVYKDQDIKDLLHTIFNKKCAYCESHYLTTSPTDIEHFRPKGRIENEDSSTKISPGYYWLAANWDNLLPSCINCNRRQYQIVISDLKLELYGKGELFPLLDESKRARSVGQETIEEPLLINPCTEDPSLHLVFDLEGFVHPKKIKGKISIKGKTTIDILGLQRIELVQQRKSIIISLESTIISIFKHEKLSQKYPNDLEIKELLNTSIQTLEDMLTLSPHTAMIKQLSKILIKKYNV